METYLESQTYVETLLKEADDGGYISKNDISYFRLEEHSYSLFDLENHEEEFRKNQEVYLASSDGEFDYCYVIKGWQTNNDENLIAICTRYEEGDIYKKEEEDFDDVGYNYSTSYKSGYDDDELGDW